MSLDGISTQIEVRKSIEEKRKKSNGCKCMWFSAVSKWVYVGVCVCVIFSISSSCSVMSVIITLFCDVFSSS